MSVCAERKRLRVRPLNLAIEVLGHEENRDTSDPLTTHSAVSPQQRKRRDLGARSSQQAFKAYKSVSVETTSAVFHSEKQSHMVESRGLVSYGKGMGTSEEARTNLVVRRASSPLLSRKGNSVVYIDVYHTRHKSTFFYAARFTMS
jgi:hypothetical protein